MQAEQDHQGVQMSIGMQQPFFVPPPLHPHEFDSTYYQKLTGPQSLQPITNCFNNFQEWTRFDEPAPVQNPINERSKQELRSLNRHIYHKMNQILGTLAGQSQQNSVEELNKELKSSVHEFFQTTQRLKAREVREKIVQLMKKETKQLRKRTAEMDEVIKEVKNEIGNQLPNE